VLISVTGGTGFLGSHAVAELIRAGHQVRLLARRRSRVAPALTPLGIDIDDIDVIVGDVCDESAMAAAVAGCDAVVNVAGVYSFDSRVYPAMRAVNGRSVEVVLGAARAAGASRIVHVSTVAALCDPSGVPLTIQSPVGASPVPYMATMAEGETVARRYQAEGVPVVILYPPATLGPHDPHLGDQTMRVRNTLKGRIPLWPTGGISIADVRDIADLIVAAVEGRTAHRAAPPATFLTTHDYVTTLRELTGLRLPAAYVPARLMLPLGWLLQGVQRLSPWHIPAEYGAIYACSCTPRFEAAAMTQPTGRAPRTILETMGDTVRWLHGQGLLTDRDAGRALTPRSVLPAPVG
jgi:dihydroflavonol-4-reductase